MLCVLCVYRWWKFDDDDVSVLPHKNLGQEVEDLLDGGQPSRKSKAKSRASPPANEAGGRTMTSTNAYMLICGFTTRRFSVSLHLVLLHLQKCSC